MANNWTAQAGGDGSASSTGAAAATSPGDGVLFADGGGHRKTIAVVDGNSLMHRAFYAIPSTMSAPDGRPTNAIYGFASMFAKMVELFSPEGIACCFDKGKSRMRTEMLPQYKAQRPPMDQALYQQFSMVKELLSALEVPVLELEGWEGDDLLGTLAYRGEKAGYNILLVTGDRDMYQLSTDHVKIVGTRKGLSDVVIMTPENVADLYHGVTPKLVPDFYGLKGDTSDNIPGVPGIGPKRAAALIAEYGDLDEIIAHADQVPGKVGENLREHADCALLSREVARICTDVPIKFEFDQALFPRFDPSRVRAVCEGFGFTRLAGKMSSLGSKDFVDTVFTLPEVVDGHRAHVALAAALDAKEWLGVSVDDGHTENTLPGLSLSEDVLWVCGDQAIMRFDGQEEIRAVLVELCKRGFIVTFDTKALLRGSDGVSGIYPADSARKTLIDSSMIDINRIFDIGIAAYLLDSSKGSYDISSLAERYLSKGFPKPTKKLPDCGLEAAGCRYLRAVLLDRLTAEQELDLYYLIELPLMKVLIDMERTGMYADREELARQSRELAKVIVEDAREIHRVAGEKFNIDSPMQLSHVLFETLKAPTEGFKETRRGFYTTNATVLDTLASSENETIASFVRNVIHYRETAKICSGYLDPLPHLIKGDGRIHTIFHQTVAATGRLSSSNPNLQNIPVRSELGRRVRSAFTVPENHVFLAGDYSQIELRLLAHLSGDEHLIAAFTEGEDFHATTAARVFGVSPDQVTPDLRSRAKAVNFGIVYGQQAVGLAATLKISRTEAQEMIDRYFTAYPAVRAYLDATVAAAKDSGYAVTMYGRKRPIPELYDKNLARRAFGRRTAMNHPMQGSAADIIKLAMISIARALHDQHLKSKLILQIHDELDFEVPIEEIECLSKLAKETMENIVSLKVPLVVNISYGATWAEVK